MNLIIPSSYRPSRSQTIRPERFSFYARHRCGAEAFWLTRRIHSPLQFTSLDISEVWFEDGQIKLPGMFLDDFNCPGCQGRIRGDDPQEITIVRILNEKDYDRLHKEVHDAVSEGDRCKSCGKIKRG